MRRYSISMYGYDPYEYVAKTASKARYQAFLTWCDAGLGQRFPRRERFREFLKRIRTLHMGAVE